MTDPKITPRLQAALGSEFSVSTNTLDIEPFFKAFRIEESQFGSFSKASYRLYADYDFDYRMMRVRLETDILKEPLGNDTYEKFVTIDRHVSPWQFFKDRHKTSWWLGWLVRRRPVRFFKEYHDFTLQVERSALYPEANVEVPALGRAFLYNTFKELK